MKRNDSVFLMLMLFLASINVYSQQYEIKGKIVGDLSNEPLEFVNVTLTKNDSIFSGAVTDELGNFALSAEKGDYILKLEQFGEMFLSKNISLAKDLDLGALPVEQSIALKEIVIEAKKPLIQQEIDRTIFNVENSIAATGGDALDALKRTPSVQVQNDNIALVGRSNVRVMVNDRMIELSGENLTNYLKSIPSDDIKSIEVITTPPAKYQAEGNSGLINIILKKGALNAWSNTIRTAYIQTTYPAYSIGNTFNYNKNKWAINASVDAKKGSEASLLDHEIFFPNARNVSQMDSKNRKDFYSGRLGIDYDISDKSTIGAIANISEFLPDSKDNSYINIFDDNNVQFSQILTQGNSIEKDKNISTNVHFIQKLDTLGKKLTIDLDYFNFKEDRNRNFSTIQTTNNIIDNFDIANNLGNQNINNYSINVNLEHPTKWANYTYGGRLSFSNTESGVKFFDLSSGNPIIDPNQTDDFRYDEYIQALYFDVSKKFGEKWQVKLGLRYEHTHTKSLPLTYNQEFTNNYGKLFPTVYALYLMNENNFLNLNYSRRTKRPGFWELNPFKWYLNANSYAEGNPFLQPSFNHNVELTHGYNQKLFSTFIFQYTEDGFGQIPSVNGLNNQQIYTRANYNNTYVFGLVENYRYTPFKWWESNNQFFIFYSETKIKSEFVNDLPVKNGLSSAFSTNNSFVLNNSKTFLGELNFNYNFPRNSGIYKAEQSYSLDFAIKYLFWNKSLVATFAVNDIFRTSNPNITTFTNNIKQVYNNYYDNRFFRFSLSYTLGNRKINVEKRSFGNEEEQNRTN
ncbi:Outer membrane receptor for Fe3+-dicitrate [Candidatus Ornithobacterium hominis]|uniref:outer membrane beta-barrel family protein n=1 Tax=Candidatus Ornithobacterium hominis TaxID=2497989 RepID=UPI000E5A2DAB|nr:outer membrane beta-barrel family protein [Candidatus Ornithobacterium hominis]SZD73263.1 Outer membrane receptor for Fe3+-dicitrate [Candidatus Ornithobacterium hominis]